MLNIILSLVLGAGLDSLYYYLYISKIKDIKENKLLLYFGIFIIYIITNMINQYNLKLYLLFDILIYLLLKFKYNAKINDFFVIMALDLFLLLSGMLCFYSIKEYAISLIVYKIILFLPLFFINKIKKIYLNVKKMWNRNREKKMPIKSLTIRNISLVILYTFIIIAYFILTYLIKINS